MGRNCNKGIQRTVFHSEIISDSNILFKVLLYENDLGELRHI